MHPDVVLAGHHSQKLLHLVLLRTKAEKVAQSLRAVGELLSTTRDVSGHDLELATQTYCSAMAQFTLLNHDLASPWRKDSRLAPSSQNAHFNKICYEFDTVEENVAILHKILTV